MKCKKCGANLEIDTAFCPYCGVANPIAKKHREDMRKFANDYENTKKEVIDNTKKFNRKTFLITVISVTFVLVALLVLMSVFGNKIKYNMEKAQRAKNSEKYLGLVEELIDKKDFLQLAEVKNRYSLRTYDTSLEKYTDIIRASEYYSYVYQFTFEYLYRSVESSYSFMDSISDYTRMIYDTYESVEDPEMKEQVGNVVSDLELFFKTFLKLTDEEIASLPDITDAQRSVLIEEAIKNAKNE